VPVLGNGIVCSYSLNVVWVSASVDVDRPALHRSSEINLCEGASL
jgi:hypothetical protein